MKKPIALAVFSVDENVLQFASIEFYRFSISSGERPVPSATCAVDRPMSLNFRVLRL